MPAYQASRNTEYCYSSIVEAGGSEIQARAPELESKLPKCAMEAIRTLPGPACSPFLPQEALRRNEGWLIGGEKHCVGENDGVIIVDHGSRRRESNLMLNEFVAMFRVKTGYAIVEPAHMELAEPSIKDAFTSCVQQGATRVIVSPFFLFPGRHWHQDIPSLAADAAREHPGVSYIVTAPLGLHGLLVVCFSVPSYAMSIH
ncbi:hypothetical protein ACLOJK_032580 [Asimina triloba]